MSVTITLEGCREKSSSMSSQMKHVVIYTDGACEPNPGPGGYGIVLIYNGHKKELSGGFRLTTNNRMEIYSAIKGLEALKEPCQVKLYSDSEYVVKAIREGWAKRWKENDWWRTNKERAVNADLWEKLLKLCEIHQVEFDWVKGHAGLPENERCDRLSVIALKKDLLLVDEDYENQPVDTGKNVHINHEGQPCRKCSTPVIKRIPKKPKKTQSYYFAYYFYCPECRSMYFVEEAKCKIDEEMRSQLDVTQVGQPCRKCSTPVVERISKKFNRFLFCPNCKTAYELKVKEQEYAENLTLF